MHIAGLDLNIPAIYPSLEYPVASNTPALSTLVEWEHSERWRTGTESTTSHLQSVREINATINDEEFRDYVGHQIQDEIILPPSAYLVRPV